MGDSKGSADEERLRAKARSLMGSDDEDDESDDGSSAAGSETEEQRQHPMDAEGLALLRTIFGPDASREELERIHQTRLLGSVNAATCTGNEGLAADDTASAGASAGCTSTRSSSRRGSTRRRRRGMDVALPDDFLTIPPSAMVRLGDGGWQCLTDLESMVHSSLGIRPNEFRREGEFYTAVLERNGNAAAFSGGGGSLGMTLRQYEGVVCVHALSSSNNSPSDQDDAVWSGPAHEAGIRVGDEILGVNGVAVPYNEEDGPQSTLPFVVEMLRTTPDPVVVHLRRGDCNGLGTIEEKKDYASVRISHGDVPMPSGDDKDGTSQQVQVIHPLAVLLRERGILKTIGEEQSVTQQIDEYTERTRQWEATSTLCVDDSYNLCQSEHTPGTNKNSHTRSSTPSTPVRRPRRSASAQGFASPVFASPPASVKQNAPLRHETPVQTIRRKEGGGYPGKALPYSRTPASASSTRARFLEMGAVRKGLCVRILNTFSDGNNTAYTVWVYDCEAETEFYAPVRYYDDFADLRTASIRLIQSTEEFPFPQKNWLPISESDVVKETKRRQLEQFLRSLCAVTYKCPLHPNLVELAIHLQSFLGCDSETGVMQNNLILNHQAISNASLYSAVGVDDGHTEIERRTRSQLKASIQRYVYRIFLLPCIEQVAVQFVDSVQSEVPTLDEMRDLERRSLGLLKERASKTLAKTQHFVDSFQDLVFEGCKEDMLSIADHNDYSSLRNRINSKTGELYCEDIFRQAIREHVEIEIYIPLRRGISTVLVNAWRHDDMSLKHKMNPLQSRPQSYFELHQESLSGWQSVIHILKEGVGRSSLPCKKLRAIVDAAKEIYRLHEEERLMMNLSHQEGNNGELLEESMKKLGADDFLPIFVFCIIMADLERPCALCALLEELCDKRAKISEVGYYFSSFQAAVTYIQEMSLTDKI